MNRETLYRLEVAPLVILPLRRLPFFTYVSQTEIGPGSLISISFGKQMVEGVVYTCQVLPGPKPSWMKFVSSVITPQFLTKEQLILAQTVSDEYFTPLGKTLRHFIPKQVKERSPQIKTISKKPLPLHVTANEKKLIQSCLGSTTPLFLDTSLISDPKKLWILLAKQTIKEKKQLLILVPEITLVFSLFQRLEEHYGKQVVALHSKVSTGAFFTVWEHIRSGEASIIVATRQGLFAPFKNLGRIIVTEEQDESYKQWDMSPRYHGRRVASFLAKTHNAQLLLTSGTPSTETLFEMTEKKLLSVTPLPVHAPLGNSLSVINLKLERYRKNFSPLSEALVSALRDTIGRGEQALLYINRQGMNAFSVCEHCKNTFRCPRCEHPLNATKEGAFHCLACNFTTSLFPSCPSCGHLTFRHIGFGTEKVEREVRKLFPKATVTRLDSSVIKKVAALENFVTNSFSGNIDILIGTQMILKDPPLPRLSLIAMIDADSPLLFPDFRADERLFQDLSRAVRQVQTKPGVSTVGQVFVQTFHPESAFFQKVSTLTSSDFLATVTKDRKNLFYPPVARLMTITCQGKTEKEVIKKEKRISVLLKEALPKEYRLRTAPAIRSLKKQQYVESDIFLRFPSAKNSLPKKITETLKDVASDCIIDVDPITQQ